MGYNKLGRNQKFNYGKRRLRAVFEQKGPHFDHFMFTMVGVMWLFRLALLVLTKNIQNLIIFTIFELLV